MSRREDGENQGKLTAEEAEAIRRQSEAEATAETLSAPPGEKALAEQLAKLQAENKGLLETLVRRQADFENYRKRVERERNEDRHRGVAALVEHLLPVLDAFDRALETHGDTGYEEYRKGVELIYRRLWDTLSKQGLHRIEAQGKRFDPHYHHAIERVDPGEHPEDTVTEELQAGYTFDGKVLRPAMVRVAGHAAHKTHDD